MSVFSQYARYYDLLYGDKDYAAEARYVAELINRHCPNASSVLDLGCGTGRHAVELAKLGFFVHGVDISEPMVELARQRAARSGIAMEQIAWSLGDVRSFRGRRQFDAVLALFHVASYQTTNDDLAQFLATAASHLRSGGVIIFDFWFAPAVLAMQPSQRVKRVENDEYYLIRLAEPKLSADTNCVDVRYTLVACNKGQDDTEVIEETHRMRYLFIAETERLLTEAGLTVTRFEEWLSAAEPSSGTWSVVAVATK